MKRAITIRMTMEEILNAEKYINTAKGKRQNPRALSKRKEKKIPKCAISLNLKILPNKSINPILAIKNSITPPNKLKMTEAEL